MGLLDFEDTFVPRFRPPRTGAVKSKMRMGKLEQDISRMRALDEETRHSGNRNRTLKLALIKEFGVCFWCGIKVKDLVPFPGTKEPPDMATIDHTVSKYFREKGERVLKVLACYPCNQTRAVAENKVYAWRGKPTNSDQELG